MITLLQLAAELHTDASGLRKRIKKHGITIQSIKQNNRINSGLLPEDETVIRSWYEDIVDGGGNRKSHDPHYAPACFYIIQLTPDTKPERIKVGMAASIDTRLAGHRCTCPTLVLRRTYPATSSHEEVVIQFLTNKVKKIGTEVFDVPNIGQTISDIDTFFSFLGIEPSFKV